MSLRHSPLVGSAALLLVPWLLQVGCDSVSPDPGGPVTGKGDQAGPFPAFHVEPVTTRSFGGPVMAHPRLQALFFANDLHDATQAQAQTAMSEATIEQLDRFIQAVGQSQPFWQTAQEYGVQGGTALPSIFLGENAPSTLDDSESTGASGEPPVPSIQAWLTEKLDGRHQGEGFGAPDENTIYLIFYPATTTFTRHGEKSCEAFGAYHSSFVLPDGRLIKYSPVARCEQILPDVKGEADTTTVSISHELLEAATDPDTSHGASGHAFSMPDDDHIIFNSFGGGEIGDLCAMHLPSFYVLPGTTFKVQRMWSNAASRAGHDPCIPSPAGDAYFIAVPDLPETLAADFAVAGKTRGVTVPVGQDRTIELQLSSNAATPGPWHVTAFTAPSPDSGLDLCLSQTRGGACVEHGLGKNGDTLFLTIKAQRQGQLNGPGIADGVKMGWAAFGVASALDEQHVHFWYGLVKN